MVVSDGGEVGDEYGGSSVVVSYDVQGSRSVVVVVWERELGDEKGHDKSNRGIQ